LNAHNLTKKPAARQTRSEKSEKCLIWTVDPGASRWFYGRERQVSQMEICA
jgi:hypothetical protein